MPHNTQEETSKAKAKSAPKSVIAFGENGRERHSKITIEFLTVDLHQKWLKEWNMCTIVMASLSLSLAFIWIIGQLAAMELDSFPYWTEFLRQTIDALILLL